MSQAFYLRLDSDDVSLNLSAFGLPLFNHMCGVFSVDGEINLAQPAVSGHRWFLCSDLCAEDSILSQSLQLPILRELVVTGLNSNSVQQVKIRQDFSQILWLNVKPGLLRDIRLFLRDERGEKLAVESCLLHCTLLVFPKDGSRYRE